MQIADALPKKLRLSRSELDQYLKVLTDDEVCNMNSIQFHIFFMMFINFVQAQFLHKTGDSGGGSYTVSILKY